MMLTTALESSWVSSCVRLVWFGSTKVLRVTLQRTAAPFSTHLSNSVLVSEAFPPFSPPALCSSRTFSMTMRWLPGGVPLVIIHRAIELGFKPILAFTAHAFHGIMRVFQPHTPSLSFHALFSVKFLSEHLGRTCVPCRIGGWSESSVCSACSSYFHR